MSSINGNEPRGPSEQPPIPLAQAVPVQEAVGAIARQRFVPVIAIRVNLLPERLQPRNQERTQDVHTFNIPHLATIRLRPTERASNILNILPPASGTRYPDQGVFNTPHWPTTEQKQETPIPTAPTAQVRRHHGHAFQAGNRPVAEQPPRQEQKGREGDVFSPAHWSQPAGQENEHR